MTENEFIDAVFRAMETPVGMEHLNPSLLLAGKAIGVQSVLDRYRAELPHVESTSTMEVPPAVFQELSGQ